MQGQLSGLTLFFFFLVVWCAFVTGLFCSWLCGALSVSIRFPSYYEHRKKFLFTGLLLGFPFLLFAVIIESNQNQMDTCWLPSSYLPISQQHAI
jgi:hypothetical protein